MSATRIPSALDDLGEASANSLALEAQDLFGALRAAFLTDWPELLPTLHPAHLDILRAATPTLMDEERRQRLLTLAARPALPLRRLHPDPQRLLRVLGGLLLTAEVAAPLWPAEGNPEAIAARALEYLGLPGATSAQLVPSIAQAAALPVALTTAALATVPSVPELRGGLRFPEGVPMFSSLMVAGIALGIVTARQDSRAVLGGQDMTG